ncbi:MAG: DUF427 domain-containing protein [Anaerolineaceae bacterium]|nr:MAG: DUF427 domain-containing protein [Anaerolineaceae bacterium]
MVKRIQPQPGQESVWDYPRPPKLVKTEKRVRVVFNGVTIADSVNAYRLLETSHPPAYYIPPADVQTAHLTATERRTMCEFKGAAKYWTITVGERAAQNAAWSYPQPVATYSAIADYLCFYASQMDACFVGDEQVQAQAGDFYGGWITSDVVGPFKGGAGTWGW